MQRFIGTWKLVSWEARDQNGSISYPFGTNAVGYIMYNTGGFMAVNIAKKDRPPIASKDIFGGSETEKALCFASYVAYCGTYCVKDNIVTHNNEINLYPNWTGKPQQRYFKFFDNYLELSTVSYLADGIQKTQRLLWERM